MPLEQEVVVAGANDHSLVMVDPGNTSCHSQQPLANHRGPTTPSSY